MNIPFDRVGTIFGRMGRICVPLVLALLATHAIAQTTVAVSGHAQIPDASVQANVKIRFELIGCANGQARIDGVAIFSDYRKDFDVNPSTGAISGVIYPNVDAVPATNHSIACNGSYGTTQYLVTVMVNGRPYGKSLSYVVGPGAFNLDTATAATSDPAVVIPTAVITNPTAGAEQDIAGPLSVTQLKCNRGPCSPTNLSQDSTTSTGATNSKFVLSNSPNITNPTVNSMQMHQLVNGADVIVGDRVTDLSATGNYLHFRTASGNDAWVVDITGRLVTGIVNSSLLSGVIASANLPNPTSTLKGGVQAKDCTGTGHVLSVNTDSSVTCSPDGSAGSGIVSLNGRTETTQDFTKQDDTNVTLTIDSSVSPHHKFTLNWSGSLAKARQHSATAYNDQANIFGAGFKQTFTPSATTAGTNHAPVTADPSSLSPGDIWLRGDLNHLKFRDNAATPATHSLFNSDDNLPGAQISGSVAIANGGTGQSTQQAAIDALTGTQSSGKYLRSDGVHSTLASIVAGDVPTLNQSTTGTAANVTGTVAIGNGGTGQTSASAAFNALSPLTTAGDILFGGASGAGTRLAANATATKKYLQSVSSGNPSWQQPDFADLSGSVACAKLPALTGNVATPAGSCATTLGSVTQVVSWVAAVPLIPPASDAVVYVNASNKLCSQDSTGTESCVGASGGGSPGGTGTEFQYRAGSSTFGAVAHTAIVNGGTNTLAAALAANAEITIPADVTQTTSALAVSTADTFLKFLSGRKLTQTTNGVDVIQVTGARFGLFGATLDCNSNTSPEYVLKVNADYTNVERATVQNCGANGGGNGLIAITGGVNHRLVRNRIFTQTAANSEYGIRVESVDAPISGTDVSHNYIEVFSDRKGIFIKQNTANAMSDVTASFNTIHHTGTGIDVHSDSISAGPLGVKLIANGFTATGVSGNPVVSIFGMRSSILSLNTMSGAGFFNNNAPFLTAHDTYESAIVGNAGYMVGTTGRLLQSLDAAHNTFVGNSGFGTSAPSGGGAFEGATSSTAGVPWSDNDVVGNNVNLDTGAGVDCFLAWPNSNNGTSFRNQFTGNNCDGDSTAGSKGVELKLGSGTGISAGDNFVGPNKLSNLEQGVVVGAGVTGTTILPQSFTNVKVKYNVANPSTQLTPVYHAGEQDFYPTTTATASAVIPAVMETPPLAPKVTCANAGGSLATNTIFVQYVYNNGTPNYSAPSTEASCAVTGPSGQVTVTRPIYFPPNATGWSVFDSSTTGTASKKLQAASSACQNLSSASDCVINVLAAGAALSTTATASAGPTSCTPISGDLCLTSSDGSIANNKLTYHDGNSNNSFVYSNVVKGGVLSLMVTGSNFVTAANTNLQTITGLSFTFPASQALNANIDCDLTYSQQTAAVADAFGFQDAAVAPTNLEATGFVQTGATTWVDSTLTASATTTATNIVAMTPSAITTIWHAKLHIGVEHPSNASSSLFSVMAKTGTAADTLTVFRGSGCLVHFQ
jgi:hypothetical protein